MQKLKIQPKTLIPLQGSKTRGGMGIYPPNNLAVFPPHSLSMVYIYICIPPNNLCLVCVGVHLNSGKKCSIVGEEALFFGLHLICLPEQNRGRGSSPQC